MSIFLRSNAFIGIVASVAEGFKNEVGGLIFGDYFLTVEKNIVDVAVPLQTTKRTPTQVHFHPSRTRRVRAIWDDLSPLWYLGSFHSHPEYGATKYLPDPSDDDKEFLKIGELEIIISIWKATRKEFLGYIREGMRLSGAVGDYYIQMSAWQKDEDGNVVELDLWCPYIDVINESRKRGIVSKWGRLFESDAIVPEAKLRMLRRQVRKYENQVFRNPDSQKSAFSKVRQTIKKISKEIS
ncbi:MAG: Mov34/MPN/PAD-1 family protein [Candidatus Sifarchaeia archaeon]